MVKNKKQTRRRSSIAARSKFLIIGFAVITLIGFIALAIDSFFFTDFSSNTPGYFLIAFGVIMATLGEVRRVLSFPKGGISRDEFVNLIAIIIGLIAIFLGIITFVPFINLDPGVEGGVRGVISLVAIGITTAQIAVIARQK